MTEQIALPASHRRHFDLDCRCFSELIARLAPLDTYEQRALARRRSAVREFDSLPMEK